MKHIDLSIYFIADPILCKGRPIVEVVDAALSGGITMLQFRNKHGSREEIISDAKQLLSCARYYSVPFLINDHVDIALEIGADGAHIGQEDLCPYEARRILGPNAILGLTAYTREHYDKIDPDVVDYVGTGPYFPTKTEKGKPVLGGSAFRDLIKFSPVPVVGIGGITSENMSEVINAGAAGVAMMRSISESSNPKEAARAFVDGYKKNNPVRE